MRIEQKVDPLTLIRRLYIRVCVESDQNCRAGNQLFRTHPKLLFFGGYFHINHHYDGSQSTTLFITPDRNLRLLYASDCRGDVWMMESE